eukprot:GHVT01093874.1.p1 GENE.GHVT01093874.1~~GHVT01093874.1.p1  ORF type:complete len:384 (+),score=40.29 GHVT01093874.1:258-1409(+)
MISETIRKRVYVMSIRHVTTVCEEGEWPGKCSSKRKRRIPTAARFNPSDVLQQTRASHSPTSVASGSSGKRSKLTTRGCDGASIGTGAMKCSKPMKSANQVNQTNRPGASKATKTSQSKQRGIALPSVVSRGGDVDEGSDLEGDEVEADKTSSSSASEDTDEDDSDAASDVEATFDFCDPSENDYHGIANLLRHGRTFDGKVIKKLQTSAVADATCIQGNVGCILKANGRTGVSSDEAGSPVMVLTLLNFRQYTDALNPLDEYLKEKARRYATEETQQKLGKLLKIQDSGTASDRKREVAILIDERMYNIPPQLIPKLFQVIADDVKWSLETPEMPAEERPFYAYTDVIVLTTVYKDSKQTSSNGGSNASKFHCFIFFACSIL